ncbi:uncharacterized protein LOC110460030 [Mizuhopecten yessoensis]|uniref:uncharacterized protein LOC110460030 n=1 Tax=Mizuhopecten yessoensis TaxID=6573 RepID=UPI000B45D732|nr:uncharacterized protein LOC110460030 [Mizuhopecten yessoensis]
MISSKQNAADSDEICKKDEGKLAYIPNKAALEVVMALMDASGDSGVAYVGYTKFDANNLDIQGTGHLQSWYVWDSGQPGGTDQECIGVFDYTRKWHDYYCTQDTIAVCSTPFVPTTVPTTEITTDLSTTESTTVVTTEATTVIDTTTCHCDCDDSPSFDIYPVVNITEELQAQLDTLRKETKVNEEMLSSTIRKRTSVRDPRPSSAYVGYLGIGLLTLIFGGIFVLDLPRVIIVFKTLF